MSPVGLSLKLYGQCRLLTPSRPILDACSLDEPQRDGVHTVVIDCSGFTFIDFVGLHVLPAVSRFKLLAYEPLALRCYDHATGWWHKRRLRENKRI